MTPSVRRIRPRSPAVNARPLRLWQDNPNAPEVRIEIVPLIDVIFCILTFFILA
ncbi:MAG: biopolymer transporter ExbD, partial [Okeania sp. SIO3C4]|nr:biopolymer transporter ExbD [Okeania sp. SIO3C4]